MILIVGGPGSASARPAPLPPPKMAARADPVPGGAGRPGPGEDGGGCGVRAGRAGAGAGAEAGVGAVGLGAWPLLAAGLGAAARRRHHALGGHRGREDPAAGEGARPGGACGAGLCGCLLRQGLRLTGTKWPKKITPSWGWALSASSIPPWCSMKLLSWRI